MIISVLALGDAFDTGLSAVLDTFSTANDLAATSSPGAPFEVRLCGVRRNLTTHQGFRITTEKATARVRPDVVVVPALGAKTPEALQVALVRPDVIEAGALLRRWSEKGTLVASACTSTFVVAASGLLDGRRATTTWWLAPLFRQRFPRVTLEDSEMVVASPGVVTAGAALAHLDLALYIVRQRSPALAAAVARYLTADVERSQGTFAIPDQMSHEDPIVESFERWARRHLVDRFSLQMAARSVGASARTLDRRMRDVLGKSPLSYVQDLRVERAVHLLRTSRASVDEVANRVGYADGVSLRNLLRRKIGRGLRELRGRPAAP
ncbi:MAG TPA: helix-turn-helix domain-containing protein [Polyangia bacterium]|jgi:transcriptional regulator GlxA family with amidase domain